LRRKKRRRAERRAQRKKKKERERVHTENTEEEHRVYGEEVAARWNSWKGLR